MTIPEASLLAVNRLGITRPSGFDGTFATFGLLQPQERIEVTRWVKNYVQQNPDQFRPAEVNVANSFGDVADLEDYSYGEQWSDFMETFTDRGYDLVGSPLVNIGESASLIAKAIPLLVIAGAIYFLVVNKSKIKL